MPRHGIRQATRARDVCWVCPKAGRTDEPGPEAFAVTGGQRRPDKQAGRQNGDGAGPRLALSHFTQGSYRLSLTLDEALAALHPSQRTAVTHPMRPLLLACGPGSGKTRILTHRIQWLINHEGLDPTAIVALTFSRAAADELHGRVVAALGPRARGLWTGTFHGFGTWLLRGHAAGVGRTHAFTILDREDSRRLVVRLAKDLHLDGDLPTLAEALERARTPVVAGAPGRTPSPVATLRVAYEARCREANAFDFLDLLVEPLALFAREPAVRAALRARFRAVLVDEAQDLCALQHALVEALAAPDGALTLAGDDDQAIYGWRGADLTRLHDFERTYPGGTVLAVGRNYRSTPQIVTTAARLIAHNRARRPKPLVAVRPPGPVPTVMTWPDDRAEAGGLAAACAEWVQISVPPIAVLARVTACLEPIARACAARGLTVRVLTDRPLAERAAVRDCLALCRVLVNPADWPAWGRVLRGLHCGIGAKTVATLRARAATAGVDAALTQAARTRPRLAALLQQVAVWRAALPPVSQLLETLARDVHGHGPDEGRDRRAEDMAALVTLARRWEADGGAGLGEFLDTVVLSEEDAVAPAPAQVLGLTLHAAKGLEFDTVVIVGVEEGLLPHYRHTLPEALAEERRLCYVGMTRARQRLVCSVARMRRLWGDVAFQPPSRFLRESGLDIRAAANRTTATPAVR
jgi:DNA helicase-2/ATP-dependent DNA helicase PcrA